MDQHNEAGKVLRPAAWGEQSTQLSTSFAKPNAVTASEFAKAVAPALTLVSPTGMTQDERKGWLHAAYKALGDVPADKLSDAVMEAMRTVDHPSKIVPAIRKALEGPSRYQSNVTIVAPSHDELEEERRRREAENSPEAKRGRHEMTELMRGLRERLEANAASSAA